MSYWYLGSPYSKYPCGLVAAFEAVSVEAGRLIRAGVPVYSPIAHTHPVALYSQMDPFDYDIWLPADRPLMEAAHGLIVLQLASWEISIGLQHEIDFFQSLKRPVVFMQPGTVPHDLLGVL